MSPATNGGGRLGPLIHLSQNWISRIGILLTTTGGVAWLFSLPVHFSGEEPHPYLGLLTFIALPLVFFLGLFLIPLGIRLKERRERAEGVYPESFPPPRWSNPEFRRLVSFVFLATAANVVIGGHLTYSAVEYMDSSSFCGQACHIMTPEFTAWQAAPHASVGCVQCHIGKGPGSALQAKLNGARQLYQVLTNTYETPVPTPVHNLAQGHLTCGGCHSNLDLGEQRVEWIEYAADEQNSATRTELRHIIGGGDDWRGTHGAHMANGAMVEYRSDPERKTIPWIRYVSPDGEETIYQSEEWDPEQSAKWELRTMDCVDCHNRTAHTLDDPGRAIDRAIASGRINSTLPSIKREGLAAVTAAYASTEEALEQIPKRIETFYQSQPRASLRSGDIRAASQALAAIYARNVFPEWGVEWGTHPSLNTHDEEGGDEGCFRCHTERHISQDEARRPVGDDCSACHEVIAENQPVEPQARPIDPSLTSTPLRVQPVELSFAFPAGAVVFDHERHVRFASGECVVCHNRLFEMTKGAPLYYAAGLHKIAEERRTSCAYCHVDGGPAFASAGNCTNCHKGLTEPAKGGSDVTAFERLALPVEMTYDTALGKASFNHAEHVGLVGGQCQTCHNRLFEMSRGDLGYGGQDLHKAAEAAGTSCAGCHSGEGMAFAAGGNCTQCHQGLEEPKPTPSSGESGLPPIPTVQSSLGETKFGHEFHNQMVGGDCSTCHTGIFPFEKGLLNYKDNLHKTAETNKTSCGSCHNPEGVAFASEGNCAQCHTSFSGSGGGSAGMPETIVYENQLGRVSYDHALHTELVGGDCSSCHDDIFKMAKSELAGYSEDYHRKAEAAGTLCAGCHSENGAAFGALNNCSRCHQGLKIREVEANGGG